MENKIDNLAMLELFHKRDKTEINMSFEAFCKKKIDTKEYYQEVNIANLKKLNKDITTVINHAIYKLL
jgi:hypothetical protein